MLDAPILTINTGSSSLKFGIYLQRNGKEELQLDGLADGIGRDSGKLEIKDGAGRVLRSESARFPDASRALASAKNWLAELSPGKPCAVGHRVVHGGPRLLAHQRITPAVLAELRACVHFAPLHIPAALSLIEAAAKTYPDVPQFACFDTVFHATMPQLASRYALARELFDEGMRRYGFHGLSYESIVSQLGTELPRRAVIAHLGNGASLAAVSDGRSIDTSMGLTPTGGIPMGTRSGDLDPGVALYLMRLKKLNARPGKGCGTGRCGRSASDRHFLLRHPQVHLVLRGRAGRSRHARLHRRHRRKKRYSPGEYLQRTTLHRSPS
jgi:acetate kinase